MIARDANGGGARETLSSGARFWRPTLLARSPIVSTPFSFAGALSSAGRSLVAKLAAVTLSAMAMGAVGCTNGAGATCEIDGDCASGLSCCNAGLLRGACQADCTGVTAPADAFVGTENDSGVADDAASSPDAAASLDAAASADAAATPDAAAAPDAAVTADANVDGGS